MRTTEKDNKGPIKEIVEFISGLLLAQFNLPAWLTILLAIYIGIPDWNSRNEFWLSVAKSSGGPMSIIASIFLWKYFAPTLSVVAIIYLVLVNRRTAPSIGPPSQHPVAAVMAWGTFTVCLLALLITAGYGAIQIYIQREIANGLSPDRIANELRGGDSFCYIFVDLKALRSIDNGFPRTLITSKTEIPSVAWWFYPPGADKDYYSPEYMDNNPYKTLSGRSPCIVDGYTIYNPTIKPGSYGIDFTGSNGSWKELLTISETNTDITQSVSIVRQGITIFERSWKVAK
jgi:hypothetical protein